MTNQLQPDTVSAPETKAALDAPDAREMPTVEAQAAGARETRPLPTLEAERQADVTEAVAPKPADVASADSDESDQSDESATAKQESVRSTPPTSRPRKTTLAVAITRPVRADERLEARNQDARSETPSRTAAPSSPSGPAAGGHPAVPAPSIPDEIDDEVDEWGLADQPTVYISPRPPRKPRPEYLETGEGYSWPPRPSGATPPAGVPRGMTPRPPQRPPSVPTVPRRDPAAQRPIHPAPPAPPMPPMPPSSRLASPSGRMMPGTPPTGVPRAALPNPRMERFQELRRQRAHHLHGERDEDDPRPVAEVVRQWWGDLLPGLQGALHYQREARASGVHPIPAYVPQPGTRLGDAFGRLTQTARDLSERAQAAAGPALKRWHDQAEQAAQALVERIEGTPARQQQPLLGPGRLAVFFRSGVTVGQAQKLLAASQARPMRLIPRKHGFLAYVTPGQEAEIGERLRVHPYVRDVAYLDYTADGAPPAPAQ